MNEDWFTPGGSLKPSDERTAGHSYTFGWCPWGRIWKSGRLHSDTLIRPLHCCDASL